MRTKHISEIVKFKPTGTVNTVSLQRYDKIIKSYNTRLRYLRSNEHNSKEYIKTMSDLKKESTIEELDHLNLSIVEIYEILCLHENSVIQWELLWEVSRYKEMMLDIIGGLERRKKDEQ